jgi:hypothetical protein
VPQQEERISQITELAVCLHGKETINHHLDFIQNSYGQLFGSKKKYANIKLTKNAISKCGGTCPPVLIGSHTHDTGIEDCMNCF